MSRTLKHYVYVSDEHGVTHAFGPDSDVPEWARKLIVNPKAWNDGTDSQSETASKPVTETPKAGKSV